MRKDSNTKYNKFICETQRIKMAELWDNKEDEAWEDG